MDFRHPLKTQVSLFPSALGFASLRQSKFDRIFPIFLSHTDEKHQMAAGYDQVFALKKQQGWLQNTPAIRVLDVGCGNGTTTRLLLETLKKHYPEKPIQILGVDNNPGQLKVYQTTLSELSKVKPLTQRADAFSWNPPEGAYDLIIASHMFYHTHPNQVLPVLQRLASARRPDGLMGVSMLDPTSDFNRLQLTFGPDVTPTHRTNPVTTTLDDIKSALVKDPKLLSQVTPLPYAAYVYFPLLSKRAYQQLKADQKSGNTRAKRLLQVQTTLDLLAFILHGDLKTLRIKGRLGAFFRQVDRQIQQNGPDTIGRPRLNFHGETLFFNDSPLALTRSKDT